MQRWTNPLVYLQSDLILNSVFGLAEYTVYGRIYDLYLGIDRTSNLCYVSGIWQYQNLVFGLAENMVPGRIFDRISGILRTFDWISGILWTFDWISGILWTFDWMSGFRQTFVLIFGFHFFIQKKFIILAGTIIIFYLKIADQTKLKSIMKLYKHRCT